MAVQVRVCTGEKCGPKGGKALIKDIEDLCGPGVVQAAGCLDACMRGPNAEVNKGGKRKVIEKIDSFKKAEAFAKSEVGAKVSANQKTLGEVKYSARRDTNATTRLALIQKGIKQLGGEDKGQGAEPRILAQLLVMRAVEVVTMEASAALKDAQLALKCAPGWGSAHLAVAIAHEALGNTKDAYKSLDSAEDSGDAIDRKLVLELDKKLESAKEEENKKQKEEEDAKKKAEEKVRQEEEKAKEQEREAKKKKAMEAKKKAAEEAKRKKIEEERKKREEEAKAKEEADRRAAEEEAARKAVEEANAKAAIEKAEAEAAAKRAAEADAKQIAEEDEKTRIRAEEAARLKAEQETYAKALFEAAEKNTELAKQAPEAEKKKAANALFACCASPSIGGDEPG